MKLELTVEETNQLLNLIAQAPYNQVFKLVAKIQAQAELQKPEGE